MFFDSDIKWFFNASKLDCNSFSFDDLVEAYKSMLLLVVDQEESDFYMNFSLIHTCVISFSKVFELYFNDFDDDSLDVYNFYDKKLLETVNKDVDLYTNSDLVLCISSKILDYYAFMYRDYIEENEIEMDVFYAMLHNCFCIQNVYDVIFDKKDEIVQKEKKFVVS